MQTFAPVLPAFGCPGRGMLASFQVGELPEDEFEALAEHVSSCDSCAAVLHELHEQSSADHVVDCIKDCLQSPPLTVSPEYVRMEAVAQSIGFALTARDRGAPAPLPPWAAGKQIGPYELLAAIGEGGMGVVYLARQVALDRLVALKMVSAGHHARVRALERFHVEGRAVARLNHPNIVHVYDFGEHEGLPYYSMELVEGGNLSKRLADGPLDLRDAAELVRTLALAVDYAHREGVIHRDLKPSNILLSSDGSPKIADFGLAKLLKVDDGDPEPMSLTETDMVLGTPSYMAPEQASGRAHEVTPATDIYALGAILYEALTGVPPFQGKSKAETLKQVCHHLPKPPSQLRPEIPRWLETICVECLEKRPSSRYGTAAALADDLGRWLDGERPSSTPGLAKRLIRGARKHAAGLIVGVVALTGGAAIYLSRPERVAERIEAKLAKGLPVQLIGATGRPKWSRLDTNQTSTLTRLGPDNIFTIESWRLTLLELVPEIPCDQFRVSAEIRHESCSGPGAKVGVFVAHTIRPFGREQAHLFLPLKVNAHTRQFPPEFEKAILNNFGRPNPTNLTRPPRPVLNTASMTPQLYVDRAAPPLADFRTGIVARGPEFRVENPVGEWHRLEVEFRRDTITIRWDGKSSQVSRSHVVQATDQWLKYIGPQLPRGCDPNLNLHGGVGLFLEEGVASFRGVSVTPL